MKEETFALWVYLGIEQLPLAAEESHDPARDMPKGILLGLLTLIVFAFLTVILNAGIAPGAAQVGRSDEPLFLGFRTIFGEGMRIGEAGIEPRRQHRDIPVHEIDPDIPGMRERALQRLQVAQLMTLAGLLDRLPVERDDRLDRHPFRLDRHCASVI